MNSEKNYFEKFLLKEIAVNVTEKNTNNDFDIVLTNSAVEGIVSQDSFFDRKIANESNYNSYIIVRPNDFIYNPRVSLQALYGPINRNELDITGIMSPLYTVFRLESDLVNTDFIKYYFKSSIWHKYIYSVSNQGARHDRMSIGIKEFFDFPLYIPNQKRQKQIADILSTWDQAIELKENLIIKSKELLDSTIQRYKRRLFSNVNFDEWKPTKLKKVFAIRKDKDYESNKLPLYSFTIEDGVSPKTDRYNRSFLVKGKKKYKVTKYNDLVFNPANLKYGAISVNNNRNDVLVSPIYETLYIKNTDQHDIDFFKYFLTTSEMISFYKSKVEGTLVERSAVKVDQFLLFTLNVPDYDVQSKVSRHLNTIDKSIELVKKELDVLKLQKKGLMQRLLTGQVRVQA
jgi:type I restriction enzyme S subunit